MPSAKPNAKPKILDEPELALPDVQEHPVGELRVEPLDHHQLDVDELVDPLADLSGQPSHHLGQLVEHPVTDQLL
jgi:hypothetical protein